MHRRVVTEARCIVFERERCEIVYRVCCCCRVLVLDGLLLWMRGCHNCEPPWTQLCDVLIYVRVSGCLFCMYLSMSV